MERAISRYAEYFCTLRDGGAKRLNPRSTWCFIFFLATSRRVANFRPHRIRQPVEARLLALLADEIHAERDHASQKTGEDERVQHDSS